MLVSSIVGIGVDEVRSSRQRGRLYSQDRLYTYFGSLSVNVFPMIAFVVFVSRL